MQLPPQDAILFDQIRQGRLLLPIPPADHRDKQRSQERNIDHDARVYLTEQDSVSRDPWAELRDIVTTGTKVVEILGCPS
jgi:hypothetical protein